MPSHTENYYDVLGVETTAPLQTITKSYRALAMKYHPDKNHSDEATEKTQRINRAYEVLKDAEERKRYDSIDYPRISGAAKNGPTKTKTRKPDAQWNGSSKPNAERKQQGSTSKQTVDPAEFLKSFRWRSMQYWAVTGVLKEQITEERKTFATYTTWQTAGGQRDTNADRAAINSFINHRT